MPALGTALGLPFGGIVPGFIGPLDGEEASLLDAFSAEFRLFSAYGGSCQRVRETGGGTELDIGFTSAGIFDDAAFTAHVGANQGFTRTWYNQFGASNYGTATAGFQPESLINQAGVGTAATLKFDAVSDRFPHFRVLNRPFTIYLVEKGVSAGIFRTIGDIDTVNSIISGPRNALNNCQIAGGTISNFSSGTNLALEVVAAPSGSGAKFWVMGTDRTAITTNTNNFGQVGIGGSEPANSCVCELLIYSVAHDDTTRARIETKLRALRGF